MQFVPVGEETGLVESVETNTRRYQALFAGAADDLMQDALFDLPESVFPTDVFDVMHAQVALTAPLLLQIFWTLLARACIPSVSRCREKQGCGNRHKATQRWYGGVLLYTAALSSPNHRQSR